MEHSQTHSKWYMSPQAPLGISEQYMSDSFLAMPITSKTLYADEFRAWEESVLLGPRPPWSWVNLINTRLKRGFEAKSWCQNITKKIILI